MKGDPKITSYQICSYTLKITGLKFYPALVSIGLMLPGKPLKTKRCFEPVLVFFFILLLGYLPKLKLVIIYSF